MYKRALSLELKKISKSYPVVTLIGPRQSGKTTLVRHVFPKKPYVNLEDPDIREMAEIDPRRFLDKYKNGAILDEIQRLPKLLSYIQVRVDEDKKKGLFILTGSHQLELHQAVSQSLTGRTALLTLFPMSLLELKKAKIKVVLNEILIKGCYPAIFNDRLDPIKAYRNYFQTYVERDIRQLVNIKDLSLFQKFVRICAGRIGQILNFDSIANDVGVSLNTIKAWISILEASFIIIKLQPYFENFGKRMIKSSKIYFIDVGLATYLLGIETVDQLERDPLRGGLIENLIVLELIKFRLNKGLDPNLYYFRDTHGHEIDIIFQKAGKLIPIEIKAAQTFNKEFLKNLYFFKDIAKNRYEKGFLIYTGKEQQRMDSFKVVNYTNAVNALI